MLPTVQGNTDVYLIPGDPVEQVRAPDVFNLIFKTLGINAVLVPVHVAPADMLRPLCARPSWPKTSRACSWPSPTSRW
jgi:shikimate 5-dehydrogenase